MKTHVIAALTIVSFACGGSQSGGTTSSGGNGGGGGAGGGTTAETGGETGDSSGSGNTDESGGKTSDAGEFQINDTDESSRPKQGKLKATATEAAVRFFVVNKEKDKGPIKGIVISLTSPSGQKYYTEETDAEGFAELLLPIGKTYDLVYVDLGRHNVSAKVEVANKPRLNLKLTMRYKREEYPTGDGGTEPTPFVLDDVHFASGKATLTGDSHARLDTIVEYMSHKKTARIEVSGHTDNVGKKKSNKRLSQKRADAVRAYLVSKGIDKSRIKAVGYGDEKPIAPNDTPEGRQKNRRIEAVELE